MSEYLLIFGGIEQFIGPLIFMVFLVVTVISNNVNAKKKRENRQTLTGEAARRQTGSPLPRMARPAAPFANNAAAVDLLVQERRRAQRRERRMAQHAQITQPGLTPEEGESHVTPMGEPYHSSLVDETVPSIEHSAEHIGSAMPEGTVAPPPPGATVKAGANIAIRRVRAGNASLPRLRLKRGQTALRSALVLREVLSRPRAYDI